MNPDFACFTDAELKTAAQSCLLDVKLSQREGNTAGANALLDEYALLVAEINNRNYSHKFDN